MHYISLQPLNVNKSNPFDNDIFSRKEFGVTLRDFVKSSPDNMVISLDAEWGEGKTTFVKMWQGLLQQSDIPSIYYDAFKNDIFDDAFASIIGTVVECSKKLPRTQTSEQRITDFINNASIIATKLFHWSAKLTVKGATLNIIDDLGIETLDSIKKELSSGVSTAAEKHIFDHLISCSNESNMINAFKESLSELAIELCATGRKPLVIIIDELDRCRPPHAVEVLEKIKHMFSVNGVVFVLAIHKPQLEEYVRHIYGQNVDAHKYLQKFIDIELALPKNTKNIDDNDGSRYCRWLYMHHKLERFGSKTDTLNTIIELASYYQLSLRQIEKCFTYLTLYFSCFDELERINEPLLAVIVVIRVNCPELFNQLSLNDIKYSEVHNKLPPENIDKDRNNHLKHIHLWLKCCLMKDAEYSLLQHDDDLYVIGQVLANKTDIERSEFIPFLCKRLSTFS